MASQSTTFLTPALREIAGKVASLLKEKGESIAVAETAAGGLISASLLAMPGASGYYKGGLTLYTLPSRLAYTSWSAADTAIYKGPTPAIVTNLASDTRATLGATYCVSESGTAGPTGGSTRNRTPGYCALAVVKLVSNSVGAGEDGKGGDGEVRAWTKEVETGSKEREENMVAFATSALQLVWEVIVGGEGVGEGTVVAERKGGSGEVEGARI